MSRLITPVHKRRQVVLAGTFALREFDLFDTFLWVGGCVFSPRLD